MIEIIALLIVAVTVYLLIKQYETRMVLIGSGLLMSYSCAKPYDGL